MDDIDLKKIGVEGACVGRGRGRDGSGGAGLLNFHLIFQKTWAEPGMFEFFNIYSFIKY